MADGKKNRSLRNLFGRLSGIFIQKNLGDSRIVGFDPIKMEREWKEAKRRGKAGPRRVYVINKHSATINGRHCQAVWNGGDKVWIYNK